MSAMSEAQTLTRKIRKSDGTAAVQEMPRHWSLAPAALPGAESAVPYPARAWHTRARLQHLPAWREHLQQLSHHDSEFTYDPGHEYEEDWTTDPDYRTDRVRLYHYNNEGFLIVPHGSFHSWFIGLVVKTLCLVLGHRVCKEPDLHHEASVSRKLGQFTKAGEPRTLRAPDVAVMPSSWTLPEARERTVEERIIRLDEGDPTPEMVLEVVSRSNDDKDFDDNMALYAALGIPEYVIADTGEFSGAPSLWLYHLDGWKNSYRMAERGQSITACGTRMRIMDAPMEGNVPVFQCQDANGQWHDHESDTALRERADMALDMLRRALATEAPAAADRIAAHWAEAGLPADVADRILDVAAKPQAWQTILGIPAADPAAREPCTSGKQVPKEPPVLPPN